MTEAFGHSNAYEQIEMCLSKIQISVTAFTKFQAPCVFTAQSRETGPKLVLGRLLATFRVETKGDCYPSKVPLISLQKYIQPKALFG